MCHGMCVRGWAGRRDGCGRLRGRRVPPWRRVACGPGEAHDNYTTISRPLGSQRRLQRRTQEQDTGQAGHSSRKMSELAARTDAPRTAPPVAVRAHGLTAHRSGACPRPRPELGAGRVTDLSLRSALSPLTGRRE
eukprot:253225-Prymnesium_polylepis.2